MVKRDVGKILQDYQSKKMYGNGFYLTLALDKPARRRVKDKLLESDKFNRFQVLLED